MRREYYLDMDDWVTYALTSRVECYLTGGYNKDGNIGFFIDGTLWSSDSHDPTFYPCDLDIALRCAEVFQV